MASSPSSATKLDPGITSEYLVPSWKVWAASTDRTSSTGSPQRGQRSPAVTWANEPHSSTVKSRSRTAPVDVVVLAIGPHDPWAGPGHLQVGHHPDAVLLLAGRADVPLGQGGIGVEVGVLEEPPPAGQAGLPLAGDHQQRRPPVIVEHGQALQEVGGRHAPGRRSRPTTSAIPGRSGVWCSVTGPAPEVSPGAAGHRGRPGWPPRCWRRSRRTDRRRSGPRPPPRGP